jgi:hypothetical protein
MNVMFRTSLCFPLRRVQGVSDVAHPFHAVTQLAQKLTPEFLITRERENPASFFASVAMASKAVHNLNRNDMNFDLT